MKTTELDALLADALPEISTKKPRTNPRLNARARQLPRMMRVVEAARVVGVRADDLWLAIKRGELPAYRVGCAPRLVRTSDLLAWATRASRPGT